jgi:DNA-binding HxlR family transcriptional regulator
MPSPALDRALVALGDRWTLQIVEVLLSGPKRYNDLSAQVTGIAPNVLAARLRHLEQARLVEATPYQERPRRLAYSLTADGKSLADVLGVLETWAESMDGGIDSRSMHQVCGTPLEWQPWCPTCQQVALPDDTPVWL